MIGAVGERDFGYVRTKDGIGLVFGSERDSYQVVSMDRDEERDYAASELTPWTPLAGERVIEADTEGGLAGLVMGGDESVSLVKWDGFVESQTWANGNLEPYCYD
jgi:hypothetical protein